MKPSQAITAQELRKTPEQIARAGWSVVIPGDVYHAIDEILIKILRESPRDTELRKYMEQVHSAMLLSAKPVRPKLVQPKLDGLP